MFFYQTQKQNQSNKRFSFASYVWLAKHLPNCVINDWFIEILSAENTAAIASYIIETVKESSKFNLINIFNHANSVIIYLIAIHW